MSIQNRIIFLCFSLSVILSVYYIKASAAAPDLRQGDLVVVSAAWNGQPLPDSATSSIPLDTNGHVGWSLAYRDTGSTNIRTTPELANATYTIELFKGTLGNSILLHSETVPSGTATTTGSFDFAFPGAGTYFLTYTATYPDGTYPIGEGPENCHGDVCILPQYSLDDFNTFITGGQYETDKYGHAIPALWGYTSFSLDFRPGPRASSVLFLPGIMESRLYERDQFGHEHLLWEPTRNDDIKLLDMNTDGSSKNLIYTRDIVDYLYSSSPLLSGPAKALMKDATVMYGPFGMFMNSLVTDGVLKEWQAFPYDWRRGADEIVQDGTLVGDKDGSITTMRLQDVVEQLASSSPTGQVTIIGHSNGGIVAKALAADMEKNGRLGLIDKIILVGTPQFGTPLTIGNLLHGDGQTRALGLVTAGSTMRDLASRMAGVFGLLPSAEYFLTLSSPAVTFAGDDLMKPYVGAYGSLINTMQPFYDFLTDTAGTRKDVAMDDLRTPLPLAPAILTKSAALHKQIDTWVPPPTTSLTSITEIGQSTVFGYAYRQGSNAKDCSFIDKIMLQCKANSSIVHEPLITGEGDNTVLFVTASANPGERFFFDAEPYKSDTGQDITHQSLLSAAPIQAQMKDIIMGVSTTERYISKQIPPFLLVPDDVVISVHSPMNIVVTDPDGHQSGVVPFPGTDFSVAKEEISGSSVQTVDDEQYVYVPYKGTYTVKLSGFGIGETSLEIGRTNKMGGIDPLQTFKIPTSPLTTSSFSLTDGTPGSVPVDVDGDGSIDMIASTTLPAEAAPPSSATMPPSTSIPAPMHAGHAGKLAIPVEKTAPPPTELLRMILELKIKLLRLFQELVRVKWKL